MNSIQELGYASSGFHRLVRAERQQGWLARPATVRALNGAALLLVRKITRITVPVSPHHTDRSIYINQQALPILIQEALSAQGTRIDAVSRATDSSDAFAQSLQGALTEAKMRAA